MKPARTPAVTTMLEPASCLLFHAPERKSRTVRTRSPTTQTAMVTPNRTSGTGCERTRVTRTVCAGGPASPAFAIGPRQLVGPRRRP